MTLYCAECDAYSRRPACAHQRGDGSAGPTWALVVVLALVVALLWQAWR